MYIRCILGTLAPPPSPLLWSWSGCRQAGCDIDTSRATGRVSGDINRSWWDLLGLPVPGDPLQTWSNLPTCPCAQLCASDTLARGRRQSSVLGFYSRTGWGAVRMSSSGVSASGSLHHRSSSACCKHHEFLTTLCSVQRYQVQQAQESL